MNTLEAVKILAGERGLTLFQLAQLCRVNYCTLKNAENRNGQLTVETIERICIGLHIPVSAFFTVLERRTIQ